MLRKNSKCIFCTTELLGKEGQVGNAKGNKLVLRKLLWKIKTCDCCNIFVLFQYNVCHSKVLFNLHKIITSHNTHHRHIGSRA